VVDRSGNAHSVWTRSDGATFRVQYSSRAPAGDWSAPVNISAGGQDASEPQLDVDQSGNLLVLWTRSDGSRNRIQAIFKAPGSPFGAPADISEAGQDAGEPQIDFDGSGKAVAVWSRSDGTDAEFCCRRVQASIRSPGANATFQAPVTLSAPGQDASSPQVDAGPDADANTVVAWTRSDGSTARVQAARRQDYVAYPRPNSAPFVKVALTPAFEQCLPATANRVHGPPLAEPSCSPPARASALSIGAKSTSSVNWSVTLGDPATEANEADVRVVIRISDVRNAAGADYGGRLGIEADLQITDQRNSPEEPESGTSQKGPLQVSVGCVSTADTAIGSTCNGTTSMNAVLPGAVIERKRAIWALGATIVEDAGANGTGYAVCPPTCGDGDERILMRQGIFVP
jgi:hypothetical protein